MKDCLNFLCSSQFESSLFSLTQLTNPPSSSSLSSSFYFVFVCLSSSFHCVVLSLTVLPFSFDSFKILLLSFLTSFDVCCSLLCNCFLSLILFFSCVCVLHFSPSPSILWFPSRVPFSLSCTVLYCTPSSQSIYEQGEREMPPSPSPGLCDRMPISLSLTLPFLGSLFYSILFSLSLCILWQRANTLAFSMVEERLNDWMASSLLFCVFSSLTILSQD